MIHDTIGGSGLLLDVRCRCVGPVGRSVGCFECAGMLVGLTGLGAESMWGWVLG